VWPQQQWCPKNVISIIISFVFFNILMAFVSVYFSKIECYYNVGKYITNNLFTLRVVVEIAKGRPGRWGSGGGGGGGRFRSRSRSRSRRRTRSRSRSKRRSRSRSRDRKRRSRTRSASRSPKRSRTRTPSPTKKRTPISRSRSPIERKKVITL